MPANGVPMMFEGNVQEKPAVKVAPEDSGMFAEEKGWPADEETGPTFRTRTRKSAVSPG